MRVAPCKSVEGAAAAFHPQNMSSAFRFSAIVNIDQIREIHREGRTECFAVLTNRQRLRMSKAGWQNLIATNRA